MSDFLQYTKDRKSLQHTLNRRLKYIKDRDILEDYDLLQGGGLNKDNLLLLRNIMNEAIDSDLAEYERAKLGSYALIPALIDLTPKNFEWLKSIHKDTLQTLSYIINRLLESLRFEVPYEIRPAGKLEVERALELLEKQKHAALRNTKRLSKSDLPEP